jgi:hypothetical protein
MDTEKTPDEIEIEEWRDAFDALTELYNAAVKRADEGDRHYEELRSSFITAIEAVMDLYSSAANRTVERLQHELDEATAENARLRLALQAAQAVGDTR